MPRGRRVGKDTQKSPMPLKFHGLNPFKLTLSSYTKGVVGGAPINGQAAGDTRAVGWEKILITICFQKTNQPKTPKMSPRPPAAKAKFCPLATFYLKKLNITGYT